MRNDINEYMNFLQDYKDCLDRMNNFEKYNYAETEIWAVKKYTDWTNKDSKYVLSLTENSNIPNNNKEKAWNAINNLRTTLDKIAMNKNIKD